MVHNDLLDEDLENDLDFENDLDEGESQENQEDTKLTELQKELEEVKNLLKESTKEWQVLGWMERIRGDKFAYIKLFDSDKKMAQMVATRFDDPRKPADIVRDLKAEMNGEEPKDNKQDIEQLLNEREAKSTLKAMQKEYKLDAKSNEKVKSAIMEEFEDLIDGKDMTPENVEKYFKKAVRIVKKLDQHEEKLSSIELELQWVGAVGNVKGWAGAKKWDFFSQFERQNHTSWYN